MEWPPPHQVKFKTNTPHYLLCADFRSKSKYRICPKSAVSRRYLFIDVHEWIVCASWVKTLINWPLSVFNTFLYHSLLYQRFSWFFNIWIVHPATSKLISYVLFSCTMAIHTGYPKWVIPIKSVFCCVLNQMYNLGWEPDGKWLSWCNGILKPVQAWLLTHHDYLLIFKLDEIKYLHLATKWHHKKHAYVKYTGQMV